MSPPRLPLALAALVIVICARIVAGGQTWDDLAYHTEVTPPRLAAAAQVQARELPAWWDGAELGVPLLGEPSHGALYPLVWLVGSPRALDWLVVAHLAWLALGVAIWARRRGASELAALGAGLFAVTAGTAIGAGLRGALFGLAYLPWIGWAAEALHRSKTAAGARRAGVVLGASLGMLALAGQPGVLVDGLVLAIVLGASRAAAARLAAAVGAGLAIGALQWLPALLVRGATAGAPSRALHVSRLLELVVPGSFGSPDPARGLAAIAGAHPYLPSLYVGAGVLALASLAVSRRIAIVAIVALVLAVAQVGAPDLHVAVLGVLAAVCAARGLDALFEGERRALLALMGGTAVAVIALVAMAVYRGSHEAPGLDHTLAHGGIGVACLLAAIVIAWRAAPVAARTLGLLALAVAPGVGALGAVSPTVERSLIETDSPWTHAIARVPHGPTRFYRPTVMPDLPPELADATATLAGTFGARWNLAGSPTSDPGRPALCDATWRAAQHDGGALLERFGIASLIVPAQMVAGMTTLGQHGAYGLVARRAAPPAAVALDWTWSTDAAATLAQLFPPAGTRPPQSAIVLAGRGSSSQESTGELVPCEVGAWDPGAIDLACDAPADGYAVISSSALPGWAVWVDDRATPWVPADVIRRAVAIPPGKHHVAWRYRPPGLTLGLALLALGIVVLVALSLVGGAADRSADPPAVRDN